MEWNQGWCSRLCWALENDEISNKLGEMSETWYAHGSVQQANEGFQAGDASRGGGRLAYHGVYPVKHVESARRGREFSEDNPKSSDGKSRPIRPKGGRWAAVRLKSSVRRWEEVETGHETP